MASGNGHGPAAKWSAIDLEGAITYVVLSVNDQTTGHYWRLYCPLC